MVEAAIKQWLDKARQDEETFILIRNYAPDLVDTAAFHAQQCVEKWLKALWMIRGLEIRKTHDLLVLLDYLVDYYPELDTDSCYQFARMLNAYSVEIRYPIHEGKILIFSPDLDRTAEAIHHFRQIVFPIFDQFFQIKP